MRKLVNTLKKFGRDEEGAALVEYAVILGIILAVSVTVFTTIGSKTSSIFTSLQTMLTTAAGG